jgi:hypothetical protein
MAKQSTVDMCNSRFSTGHCAPCGTTTTQPPDDALQGLGLGDIKPRLKLCRRLLLLEAVPAPRDLLGARAGWTYAT